MSSVLRQLVHRVLRRGLVPLSAALLLVVGLMSANTAVVPVATTYAPLNRPGPALSVPAPTLARALTCSANVRSAVREAVLLVPGTTTTPTVDFGWNYERAFTAQGRPWCAITLPQSAMGDIQTAGEYVVYAIRTMYRETGHKVQIVGHSQGGMVPRWALRFWPDTRPMVDDLIGLAPSNHGTVDAVPLCAVGCAPAIWQQRTGSAFLAALNSGAETFAGISYTDVYTILDEVVVPNLNETGSSSLRTGQGQIANISVQSVCPGHVADHLSLGTFDPVGYALVMDALNHVGPADPARISKTVCTQLLQPGVNPATFATDFAQAGLYLARVLALTPHVPKEPALASYVTN